LAGAPDPRSLLQIAQEREHLVTVCVGQPRELGCGEAVGLAE
jgi:hypothetical protein